MPDIQMVCVLSQPYNLWMASSSLKQLRKLCKMVNECIARLTVIFLHAQLSIGIDQHSTQSINKEGKNQ